MGMGFPKSVPDFFFGHMRIVLRGRDVFMPQHFLHMPQVGAAIQQVGCERMPEGVCRIIFGEPKQGKPLFYGVVSAPPGKGFPEAFRKRAFSEFIVFFRKKRCRLSR